MDLTDWLDVCALALHSLHLFSQTLAAVVVYIMYDLSVCIYVYIQAPVDRQHHPSPERVLHGAECVQGGHNTPYSSHSYPNLHSLHLYSDRNIEAILKLATGPICKMRYNEDIFKVYTNNTLLSQIDCSQYRDEQVQVFSQSYIDYQHIHLNT